MYDLESGDCLANFGGHDVLLSFIKMPAPSPYIVTCGIDPGNSENSPTANMCVKIWKVTVNNRSKPTRVKVELERLLEWEKRNIMRINGLYAINHKFLAICNDNCGLSIYNVKKDDLVHVNLLPPTTLMHYSSMTDPVEFAAVGNYLIISSTALKQIYVLCHLQCPIICRFSSFDMQSHNTGMGLEIGQAYLTNRSEACRFPFSEGQQSKIVQFLS